MRAKYIEQMLTGPKRKKVWMHNYIQGTKYELYQVPL